MKRVEDAVGSPQENRVGLRANFEPDHENLVQARASFVAILLLGVVLAHQRNEKRVELDCQVAELAVVHEFVREVVVEKLVLVELVRLGFLKVASPLVIQELRVDGPVLSGQKHGADVVIVFAESQSVPLATDQVSEFQLLSADEVGVRSGSSLVDS